MNQFHLRFSVLLFTALAAVNIFGCRSIKPYEKEYLVHPTMDDASVERLKGPFGQSKRSKEKLSASGAQSSTSCPTCGG